MSGYRLLHCKICDTDIALGPAETFNRDTTRVGVFCDECWCWQKQIDELKAQVEALQVRGVATTPGRTRICWTAP